MVLKYALLTELRYTLLAGNLLLCDNLRSANNFIRKIYNAKHADQPLRDLERQLDQQLEAYFTKRGVQVDNSVAVDEYPDRSFVRRELYPWNRHEPDRFLEDSILFLNERMQSVAPDLEVKTMELPDLAKAYVAP